jgi:hypothetical protein
MKISSSFFYEKTKKFNENVIQLLLLNNEVCNIMLIKFQFLFLFSNNLLVRVLYI